jgi:hypothetical protein
VELPSVCHREARERRHCAPQKAIQSQQTRDRLERLEAQEIQRQRNAAVGAAVQRLGDALVPRVDPVMQRLDEIEDRLDETPYDPERRLKFDWQP